MKPTDSKLFSKQGSSGAHLEVIGPEEHQQLKKWTRKNPFKLVDQYCWLHEHKDLDIVPRVKNPTFKKDYFSYEMDFYNDFESLNYFISKDWDRFGKPAIKLVLENLERQFYKNPTGMADVYTTELYLQEKLYKKVTGCLVGHENQDLFLQPELIINGKSYQNFRSLWTRIKQSKKLVAALSNQPTYLIHGDLTAENILVSKGLDRVRLIDPNQENFIPTKALEFGKLFQSFHSSYENMHKIKILSVNENHCNFDEYEFKNDALAFGYLEGFLSAQLNVGATEVTMHEAIHFARMLPYKLIQNPDRFPLYYCRMIQLLNESLDALDIS